MMKTAFKGNILTAKRIAIYALLFIVLLAALCYAYFWHWSYPLFQLIGAWQEASVVLQSGVAALLVLAVTYFLFTRLFPNHVYLELSDQELLVKDRHLLFSFPLGELKRINLLYRHQQLCRITIYGKKRRYVNVGGILKGLPEAQFQHFIGQLKNKLHKEFSFEMAETHQRASKMNNVHYDLYAPTYELKSKQRKVKRWIIAGIFIWLVVVGLLVYSFILWMDGDGIMTNGDDYGSSQFSLLGHKVYYLDVGNGYHELEGAHATSFSPFTFGNERGTEMGADSHDVYWGKERIAGIERDKAVYLGKNYIRDDQLVFYKDIPIGEADAKTFHSINQVYNTPVIAYAADKKQVYYKQHNLPGLKAAQMRFFDNVIDVVADSTKVYYRAALLDGLDGRKADIRRIDHHLVYSTDHQSTHFVNDIAFPDRIADPIWGVKKMVDLSSLHLLQEKSSSSAHLIFSDGTGMYYYDEEQGAFYRVRTHEKPLVLQKLGERTFTDGEYVYFTERKRLGARHRSGSPRSLGVQTKLYRLKKVTASDFKRMERGEGYEIFSDGKNRYISVYGYGNKTFITSGLYYLTAVQVDNIHALTAGDLADINQKEKIFHINSRNYYPKRTR